MFEVENKFLVSYQQNMILILKHQNVLTKSEALNLAAWLVVVADDNNEFNKLLEAVKNA